MEGANLVSAAIIKANKPEAANDLLRQRAVVDYFARYVRTDGQEKAPSAVRAELLNVLGNMKEVFSKETLGLEDVQAIKDQTDQLFSML